MSLDDSAHDRIRAGLQTSRNRGVFFILLGLGALGLSMLGDAWCVQHVQLAPDSSLRKLGSFLSHWMDWPWVLGTLLLGALFCHWRGHHDSRRFWIALLLAAGIAGGSATVLRSVIGRTRPSANVTQGWYGPRAEGRWLVGVRDYNAFPSGHTATLAGVAALLVIRRHRAAPVGISLTALVAWARLSVGAHRLSDVVASTLLAALVVFWLDRKFLPSTSTTASESTSKANSTSLTDSEESETINAAVTS
jgi:membrane-associated phospholipid phosphatase